MFNKNSLQETKSFKLWDTSSEIVKGHKDGGK